jgi:hypothetical protein
LPYGLGRRRWEKKTELSKTKILINKLIINKNKKKKEK